MTNQTLAMAIAETETEIDLTDIKPFSAKSFRRYKHKLELMSAIHAEIAFKPTLESDNDATGEEEDYVALFFPVTESIIDQLP